LAVAAAVVAFVLVLARQPHAVTRPQFLWEETAAFWATSFVVDPVRYLVEPWAGSFVVIPRAGFLIARLGPPEIAPAITIIMHAMVIAMVAWFLASERMAAAIPDRRIQLTFATSIAILPVAEPYVSILSAHWFLALYLVGLSRVAGRRIDIPLVVGAGLSGVGAALAAPLFFLDWRPGRRIDRRGLALIAALGAQGLAVLASGRQPRSLDLVPIVLGAALTFVLVAAPRVQIPRRTLTAFGLLALATFALGAIAMGVSGRYLLAGTALVGLVVAAWLVHWRPIGIPIAVVSAVLVIAGFPIPPVTGSHWASQSYCIGSAQRCRVLVEPIQWSVEWSPSFLPPRGMDQDGMPRT